MSPCCRSPGYVQHPGPQDLGVVVSDLFDPHFMIAVLFGLLRPSRLGMRCSKAACEISISSSASSGVRQPTVTMSQGRMVCHEKVRPTKGETRPAAIALIVI